MSQHSNKKFDKNSVTDLEKELLKKSIFTSIKKLKAKKRLKYFTTSAAAVIVMALGVGLHLKLQSKTSEISNFVKSTDVKSIENTNNVKLIIANDKNVKIDGENTSISYSKTGSKVNIGNSQTLTQDTNNQNTTKYNTLVVPFGKRSFLTLADGSKVWLNSGSKFVYPVNFSKESNRVVYLVEGEAAFDVAHNPKKPFIMMTENQEIEVLGTVFNVSNYSDDTNNFVVLKSGSVQVSYPEKHNSILNQKKKIIIKPGQMANINKATKLVTAKRVNTDHYFSWKDGVLILDNSNLNYITKKLSRYYNIAITIDDEQLKKQTFSGHLDLKDAVEKVIETIIEAGTAENLNYKITNNNLILTNKTH